MHHPGCAGGVGLGRLAELLGCGELLQLPAPCHRQAGQGFPATSCLGCRDAQRRGRAVLPPRPARGVRMPIVSQEGSCCPWALPGPFPSVFRQQQDAGVALCVKSLLAGQGVAVGLSLSLKHSFPSLAPRMCPLALMPTSTKILFFMPFSIDYTCPWLGESSTTSALNHVVLPAW